MYLVGVEAKDTRLEEVAGALVRTVLETNTKAKTKQKKHQSKK